VLNGHKNTRPLCQECKSKPAAYNYRRGDKVYYRKKSEGIAVQTSQHLHGREQVITKRKIVKCVDSLHSIHIN
jgi:hypothetical protein